MSISDAIAEIGKMARFAKAVEGADAILKELAGYAQNKAELTAAIAKLKTEKAAADAALVEAQEGAAALLKEAAETADNVIAEAQSKASTLIDEAKGKAKSVEARLADEVKAATEKLAALKAETADAEVAANQAAKDLAILTGNLDEAKVKLRALVA